MVSIPDDLIETMCDARHVVVLTGAGISAESGVPTFREAQKRIPTVEINPQQTTITPYMTYVLPGLAGEVLPALVASVKR